MQMVIVTLRAHGRRASMLQVLTRKRHEARANAATSYLSYQSGLPLSSPYQRKPNTPIEAITIDESIQIVAAKIRAVLESSVISKVGTP